MMFAESEPVEHLQPSDSEDDWISRGSVPRFRSWMGAAVDVVDSIC